MAHNYVRDYFRSQNREGEARTHIQPMGLGADIQEEISDTLKEFQAQLTPSKADKLRRLWERAAALAGKNEMVEATNRRTVSPRTWRHWQLQMHREFLAWQKERERKNS